MFYDLAITFDTKTKRCDLTIGADGDLAIDQTPIPAIIMSLGLDRHADIDDLLPEGRTQFLTAVTFAERRGSIGDAFDPFGERTGSKLWLLDRAKQTDTTLKLASYWLSEALEWANSETGTPAQIEVSWLRPSVLGYRVLIEDASLTLTKRVT